MAIAHKELQLKELASGSVIEVRVTGKLDREDYEQLVPEVERLIKLHGKIRVLFYLDDFHGWTSRALWQDIKFDVRHFADISRLAIVGESKWHKGMAEFCKPFTTAEVKYFDHDEVESAKEWISEGLE